MIEIQNVSKTFHTKDKAVHALKNISISIEENDVYGIIGYSGAGKSTLIRLINALEKPDSGEVLIKGVDINCLSKEELLNTRRKIGMIFQNFNLLNSVNVFDNIAAPLRNNSQLKKNQIEEKVDHLLEIVDLKDKKYAYPSQLSGGQKQRVAIARALCNDPEILLCDEATSALDPNTTQSILDLLLKIKKQFPITIVLITHQMDVVKYVCNKVAILSNGVLVESGSLIDVFSNPKQPQTKDFIQQSLHSEQILEKQKEFCVDFYQLQFLNESVHKPIVSTVLKKFNVDINILYGNIENLGTSTFGTLIVTLSGDKIKEALAYLKNEGVVVEVIPYVQ